MKRALSVLLIGVLAMPRVSKSQDVAAAHPDRFGLGVSGITGSFDGFDVAFPGLEGFIRVARSTFWSARVDGAYYGGHGSAANACPVAGTGGCGEPQFIKSLSTLIATLSLGPTASNGRHPFYGLLGVGGVVVGSGGPSCSSSFAPQCGPSEFLALDEIGVGSEFRLLGGNRIELRVHSASRSLLFLSSGEHPAVGASLSIGVIW